MRRDPRDGSTLADRLAGAGEVERLQITNTAMNGAQMIERSTAAKVLPLDERDRKTPLRGRRS